MKSLLFLALLLISTPIFAKRFASQYCEFELPGGWNCALEGSEWVCQSENADRKKESIIILAAKKRGKDDSLESYQTYLKSTKTFTVPGGNTQVSEPKYSKVSQINNHPWVDSLHLASEVPGFYTRYLATVKEDLGVAVTFSVGKDFYTSYQPIFDKVVASLRVFRQKDVSVSDYKLKDQKSDLIQDTTFIPDSDQKFDITQRKKKGGGAFGDSTNLYLLIGAVVIALLFFLRKKKK